MTAYNETLIITNFQVEPIIGLRDMGGQSRGSKFVKASVQYVLKHEFLCLSNNLKFRIRRFCWLLTTNLK